MGEDQAAALKKLEAQLGRQVEAAFNSGDYALAQQLRNQQKATRERVENITRPVTKEEVSGRGRAFVEGWGLGGTELDWASKGLEALVGFGDRGAEILTLGNKRVLPRELPRTTAMNVGGVGADVAAMSLGGAGLAGAGASLATRAPTVGRALQYAGQTLARPTNAKQAAATGGLYAAATTPGGVEERGKSGIAGGAMGAAGHLLPRAVARGVVDPISDVGRRLAQRGVPMTPLRAMGQHGRNLENWMAENLPFFGAQITRRLDDASEGFQKSVMNRALSAIGKTVPKKMRAGTELNEYVHNAVSSQFDDAIRNTVLTSTRYPRMQHRREIDEILTAIADHTTKRQRGFFQREIAPEFDKVFPPARDATASGPQINALMKLLRDKSRKLWGMGDDYNQALGGMLDDLHTTIADAVKAQNPHYGKALEEARTAWARYKVGVQAAGKNPQGQFTPSQFNTALKRYLDRHGRPDAIARGKAPDQQFLQDIHEMFGPGNMPRAGSSGGKIATGVLAGLGLAGSAYGPGLLGGGEGDISHREIRYGLPEAQIGTLPQLLAGGAGLGLGAAYTPTGRALIAKLMASPAGRQALANALRGTAPIASRAGTSVGIEKAKQ